MASINIVPMLMTYMTSQTTVTTWQIMLGEEKPVITIAGGEMQEGPERTLNDGATHQI
jgi:hypothetical protein